MGELKLKDIEALLLNGVDKWCGACSELLTQRTGDWTVYTNSHFLMAKGCPLGVNFTHFKIDNWFQFSIAQECWRMFLDREVDRCRHLS